MNKIKMTFIAIAIFAGVGVAFKTRPCVQCENHQQYVFTGSVYEPVGEYGVEFDCASNVGTCSYYRPDPISQPNVYAPCHQGGYTPL